MNSFASAERKKDFADSQELTLAEQKTRFNLSVLELDANREPGVMMIGKYDHTDSEESGIVAGLVW